MRFEQHIGSNCGVHFVGGEAGKSSLRMLADVSVWPAVKPSLFDMREVVGRQAVAEAVPLLHQRVEFAGLRMESERGWIAHAGSERRLLGAVAGKALDGRLRRRLDADVAGGAYAHKQRAGFWIDNKRAILMALDDTEHALRGDHFCAIRAVDRLSLVRRHLIDTQRFATSRAQGAKIVRHAPDAVLIGHQDIIVAPGKTVRPIEILDVPINPCRVPAAVAAQ
jgi:hypothetical protein